MIKLAVIADDLTGANDTGVQFAKIGMKTIVLFDVLNKQLLPSEADVVVVDSDSRGLSASGAYERVKKISAILREYGVGRVYKKIDSTLRGNLGAEINAMCEEFQPQLTIIAPAFPSNKRVTVGGFQLLEGLPISLTEIAHDPTTPVHEAWIPKVLQMQAQRKVGAIGLQDVMGGVAVIRTELAKHLAMGEDWLVFDAVTQENLQHIAEAAAGFERVLWVGSAGLAEQLPGVFQWLQADKINTASKDNGVILVVVGSASKISREQIATYLEHTKASCIAVDSVLAILEPEKEIERCIACAERGIALKQNLLITCSSHQQAVQDAVRAGNSVGLSREEVSEQISFVLGQIVLSLSKYDLAGMFLTGGETAISTCRALQAEGIEIIEEVMPGIPLGRLFGGALAGLQVVTKAGAFGEKEAIIKAINVLQRERE